MTPIPRFGISLDGLFRFRADPERNRRTVLAARLADERGLRERCRVEGEGKPTAWGRALEGLR